MTNQATSSPKSKGRTLTFIALAIAGVGLAAVALCIHGFATGWLTPHWQKVTEPQASLIAAACTVYAAAFASVVVPALFGGQLRQLGRASEAAIQELKGQFAEIAREQQQSGRQILDLAEQSKASLNVLQSYALHTMGFVEKFTEADLPGARKYIEDFQQTASILCQEALSNSSKWASTKERFNGKWPGRAPYIHLLFEHRIISVDQRDKFLLIADSLKYTRVTNPEQPNLVQLNLLNKTMRELKATFSDGA